MLDVLSDDYIRTARAKGLRPRVVLTGHALRNALIPVLTILGLQFGLLLGGAVIVENVFSWPGVGRLVINSIGVRDYPVVQAAVIVLAIILLTVNLLIDLLYTVVDPACYPGLGSVTMAPSSTDGAQLDSQLTISQQADRAMRARSRHRWQRAALTLRRDPSALFGIIILGIVLIAAIFAPLLAPHDPHLVDPLKRLIPPFWVEPDGSMEYILGTDAVGRDILSRIIYGARISLQYQLSSVILSSMLGVTLGLLAGYYGGWLDSVIIRVVDIQLAYPLILFAITVAAISGLPAQPDRSVRDRKLGHLSAPVRAKCWSVVSLNTWKLRAPMAAVTDGSSAGISCPMYRRQFW